ncbi:sugar phosphate permease [Nocardioides zeae]|uniref:Sugar phosphate permease n=1 Tax=Nocardioides zeae TaxID=1457234 RepID=A0ACC6IIM4_9ACTN|nr:MFS transporter [Nocardioides zeae]MDR6176316.1 sugar phosphate permease [Nocardioides zeae]MDR6210462.1 sugar phosphate permease [Nocardioides zeae]
MSNYPGGVARTHLVWAVAVSVYLLAVFHRSSLAVAGLLATERFDITAAQLATFVMLQLAVYAAMQVPVGLLVDRFGSRSILTAGVVVMSLAQTGFAFADTYGLALVARLFVGMGDALTFICVLRLVTSWFPTRQVPLFSQLTGTVGQLGAVVAAVPMTLAFRELGWTTTYLVSALVGVVLLVVLLVVVRDTPDRRHLRGASLSWRETRASLAASWTHPATRLGFWMHFVTQFSATALGLLWGYPFLVRGEGLSEATAGGLLTLMVLVMMVAGPTLGWLVGTFPYHRSTMVLGIVGAIVLLWTVVLAWPGDAPLPLLVLLVVVTGVGGPASMIGFDVARTANPVERLASATGLVNQGGFIATLSLVIGIGLVLDWRTPGGGSGYTADAFRWAMSLQYVLWTLGLTQVWRLRRTARAHAAAAATP